MIYYPNTYSVNKVVDQLVGGIAAFSLILVIGFLILLLVGRVLLFKKCGQSWWKAIIPFYSTYVFQVEICGLHWAWYLGYLVLSATFLNRFVNGIAFYNLAKKTGKDPIPSMIFGGFFTAIVTMIYGVSNIEFKADAKVKSSGIF